METEKRKPRNGAAKGSFGNAPFDPEPHRESVRIWAKIASRQQIADYLGVTEKTVTNHFSRELKEGRFDAVANVGGKLLEKALKGDRTCMIFYLRTQGKWNTRLELSGPDGGPMRHIDLSEFLKGKTEEEIAQIEPFLEELLAAAGSNDEPGHDR